ncbi:iron-siderophore ABC transporter substrate-binding protein [Cohnella thailandensis]|uniref:Iron-siderophore ABC transporter substrate-binding protein n=2 Tax=Cohnella thailandensis TaxID=557557 RepID=A0A841SVQ1_9BACL|nr:iron-siderophore ABC transporter substrate-binding protein [Cohnella thailandensis]
MGMPFVMLLIAMMLVLSACGGNSENNEGNAEASGSPAASGAASSSQGAETEERIVKHAMGETKIKGTPKVVVTLYQGANDTAVAFGIKPAGIVESWVQQPIYEYLRQDLEGIPLLGTEDQPNLEELYKLKPDVIFATKLRHEKIYDQLSQIAPTVMIDQVYDWKDTVRLMGETMNMQDKANELMKKWDDRVNEFKTKMGDKLPIEATITNFRADHARIFYMGYAGIILKDLGFSRPPGHDSEEWGVQLTSKESIPDMNADVIFNFNSEDESGAVDKLYKEWTEHPLWKNLDAVKNDKVYQVDGVAWNFAGGYLSAHLMLDQINEFFLS